MNKTRIAFVLCSAVALSVTALADDDKTKGAPNADRTTESGKSSQLSRSDQNFIKDACDGGHMELQMGKLGVQKGQSSELKQFGQRLIDDHTKAGTELKQLAATKGLMLPEKDKIAGTPEDRDRSQVRDKDDAHHADARPHAEMKKLEGLSGAEFDQEFAKMGVRTHEKTIKEFEKAAKGADDSDVKAFAAKTLPTLREHLQQAKNLQASTK